MARTKQSVPMRRAPSSEYVQGEAHGTPTRSPRNMDKQKTVRSVANGQANGNILKPAVSATKEAGALQFIIAVGGIYGSL